MLRSSARQPSELPANVPLFSRPPKVEINNLTGRGTARARSRWMKRGIRLLFAAVLIVAAGHALPIQNLTRGDPPAFMERRSKQTSHSSICPGDHDARKREIRT